MRLEVHNLSKVYPNGVKALDDVSFTAERGVLGLLGPNGAGKSSLLRILATVARPTSGSVSWDGCDALGAPDRLRSVLGYLPQDFGLYPHLDAVEFLGFLGALKGLRGSALRRTIDELLCLTGLSAVASRRLETYSGGMRQRVGIAQALLANPKVLILDEPSQGLDHEQRSGLRDLLGHLAGERLIIVSTHVLADIESLATSIALIRGGRLVAHAAPADLLAALAGQVWEVRMHGGEIPEAWVVSERGHWEPDRRLRVVSGSRPHPEASSLQPNLSDVYAATMSGRHFGRGS